MRRLVIAAVVVALACRGEDSAEEHVRKMSSGISVTAGEPDHVHTYELEMPQGWSLRYGRATLVDASGRSFKAHQWGGSKGSSGPDTFRGSFRTPDDFKPVLLRIDGYEIDLRNGRIKETQTPAP